jgi:hypothetical protein
MYLRPPGFRRRTAIAMAVAFMCGPAIATPIKVCDASGPCGLVQAIDDAQLADVAGKFTIAGEVVGMSLHMTSSWQSANGQRLDGAASVSIALPNSGQAQAHFSSHAGGTDPQNPAMASTGANQSVSHGSGLQSIAGVAQVIQVAGDGNGALNRASVRVTTDSAAAGGGNGRLNASYAASNGAQASVNIGDNGVAMRLTMPGAGIAQQQINMAGSGSIHQNIQVAANQQQVVNQMHLQLQIQPYNNAVVASQGLAQALNMLRGR